MNQISTSHMQTPFDRRALRKLRRDAVLRVSATAFNQRGFHNTSMDDIAAALNITKPTLYKYFPNKQKLLLECHQLAMDFGVVALTNARRQGRSGFDKLRIFTNQYMRALFGELGTCPVLADVDSLSPSDRKAVVRRRAKISQSVRGLIAEGLKDGSIAPCDPKLASLFILGVVNWIPVWFRPDGERPGTEIAQEFDAMFERTFANK